MASRGWPRRGGALWKADTNRRGPRHADNCHAANSACSAAPGAVQCVFNALECSTGLAGLFPNAYICPADRPLGYHTSLATGGARGLKCAAPACSPAAALVV